MDVDASLATPSGDRAIGLVAVARTSEAYNLATNKTSRSAAAAEAEKNPKGN